MPIDSSIQNSDHALNDFLLRYALCTRTEAERAQRQAACFQQTLFQYIAQHHSVDAEQFLLAASRMTQLPALSLMVQDTTEFPAHCVAEEIIKKYPILPIHQSGRSLIIAIANPLHAEFFSQGLLASSFKVALVMIRYDVMHHLRHQYLCGQHYSVLAEPGCQDAHLAATCILSDAIHRGVSDVHLEMTQDAGRVRFRLDGLLQERLKLPMVLTHLMLNRLKIMANLDIATQRTPQDGRFDARSYLGFRKECRISTCPTLHGEKVALRFLDGQTQIRSLAGLGLNIKDQRLLKKAIKQPQGMIIVTGPTGSGKTSTLYALLNMMERDQYNIVTIEDPIEIAMTGINQTAVHEKIQLTFSGILRTLLRQDPDILMIGEIRDKETAKMALRAAQTGHLVLSSMHTNSALESIDRFMAMGIDLPQLSGSLSVLVGQRLLRKLCAFCKGAQISSQIESTEQSETPGMPDRCCQCHDGYLGRIGVFDIITQPTIQAYQLALQAGTQHAESDSNDWRYRVLREEAMRLVQAGVTSLDEVDRVILGG